MSNHNEISSFIWNVCDDVLRGLFKQHEYGDVILPFVVLRRLDCVLEGKKDEIIKVHREYRDKFDDTSKIIHSKLNLKFSNYSEYDLRRLKDEPKILPLFNHWAAIKKIKLSTFRIQFVFYPQRLKKVNKLKI